MKKDNKTGSHEEIDLERRKAFRRLGLAASAVYVAPALMTLSQAHAASTPSTPSAPSAPSGVSEPSVPSGVSTPSGPSSPDVLSSPSAPSPTK